MDAGAVVGFVHVKDALGAENAPRLPASAIRPLPVVRADAALAEVLLRIRRTHSHLVLVTDGRAPLGVASLEDVLMSLAPVAA
jgi:CBS domain containing-hemolysin-like protein